MADVLILHSALGLRPTLLRLADRLRAAGHRVSVPDYYAGATFETAETGMAHGDEIGWPEQKRRVREAYEAFAAPAPVVVGFSLGAAHVKSLVMSRPEVAAGVMVGAGGLEEGRTWPFPNTVEIHHMVGDTFVPAGAPARMVEAVGRAGGHAAHYIYPGDGHLFMDEDGDDFDPTEAALFNARLDALLDRF